ncbi:ATP-binding protein [Actinomadura meridiana]
MLIDVAWPAESASVGRARHCVRGWLGDVQGLNVDDVELMVSELVTNACQHSGAADSSGGQVRLVAVCGSNRLWLDVTDEGRGATVPVPRCPSGDDDCGRGLMIMAGLADAWGHEVDPDTGARTVWVEVARRTRPVPDGEAHGEEGRAAARCDVVR